MKIEFKELLDGVVRCTTTDERWYLHPLTKTWIPSATWITTYVPAKELMIWMAKKGWDEAELIKREAGARGSRVHKGIEILATGGEVKHNDCFTDGEGEYKELSVQEYEAIISFKEWCDEVKPEFLATEKTVFNLKDNYAGTLDSIVKIDGTVYLIDFKTSAEVYPSHKYQISSYLHCDDVKAEKMAILQIGYAKNKKKFKFTEIPDKFDLFLAAKKFWAEENEGKLPKQMELPLSLRLNLTK